MFHIAQGKTLLTIEWETSPTNQEFETHAGYIQHFLVHSSNGSKMFHLLAVYFHLGVMEIELWPAGISTLPIFLVIGFSNYLSYSDMYLLHFVN